MDPWLTLRKIPSIIPPTARVMIIGGTFSIVTPNPFTKPISAPNRITSAIIIHVLRDKKCGPCVQTASKIPPAAITQGTDRSSPPPIMTNVWPKADNPVNAPITKRSAKWFKDPNPGDTILVTAKRATTTP
jgi:hypothetical protein